MNRKTFLIKSGLGVSGVLVGGSYFVNSCSKPDHGMDTMTGEPVSVTEGGFVNNLPAIPTAAADFKLTPGGITANIPGFGSTTGLGYSSAAFLGPVFKIRNGETFSHSFQNNLDEATNIHWHGVKVPANMDGHPETMLPQGATFAYTFPIQQRAGTSWYHPHVHGTTGKQVFKGLAGFFIVEDDEESALNLPSGDRELLLVLQDKRITGGSITYNPTMEEQMVGYMGAYVLVNGAYAPVSTIDSAKYRVRILNGSNARIYNLALSGGQPISVIGNDGGSLARPVSATTVMLAPGERVDLLLDFSGMDVNQETFLVSKTFEGGVAQGKQEFKILKFLVDQKVTDSFALPGVLSAIEVLNEGSSSKTRTFDVSNQGMGSGQNHSGGMMSHTINGKSYEGSRIDESVNIGAIEIWTFDNTNGLEPHPMHIHGVFFQILDRTGGRNIVNAYERGWKDTVLCLPGEKIRVLIRFDGYAGKFVFHCHNLEHSDTGMMLNYQLA